MKKILVVMFILIGYFANSQVLYDPSKFTVSNKSFGTAQGVPTEARSYMRDTTLPSPFMRPYNSRAEVLSYLYLAKYRVGQFSIIIDSGGHKWAYWFRDSTRDQDLVLQYNFPVAGADSTTFATNYRVDTAKTNLRNSIAGKLPNTLASGKIWVGDISGNAQQQTPSGSLQMTVGGSFSYNNNSITYGAIQQMPGHSVIGRPDVTTGNVRPLYLGYGVKFDSDTAKVDTTALKSVFGSQTTPGNNQDVIFNNNGILGGNDTLTYNSAFRELCLGCNIANGDAFYDGGGASTGTVWLRSQNGAAAVLGDTVTLQATVGTNSMVRAITNNTERFKINNTGSILLPTLTSNTDTSANKPAVFNPTTKEVTYLTSWPSGGGGGGNTNSNIGSGYRWAVPGTNNIKTAFPGFAILMDSTSNTNGLTFKFDSTAGSGFHTQGYNDLRYQGKLTLTTTGSSGPSTLVGNTLNIPQYTGGGGGVDSTYLKLGYISVAAYGAVPDGINYSDGNITVSTNTLTSSSATFTSSDVGKYIAVGGAGASGAELITTISGFTNSHTVTLTASAGTTVTNANFKYGTDNTTPIQNAINAACLNNSATVFFPADHTGRQGRYFLNGAPVTNVGGYNPNSQLYIPLTAYSPSDSQTVVKLLGEVEPNLFIDFAAGQTPPNAGVVLESVRNDSASSVLSTVAQSAIYGVFNWRMVYMYNIQIRTKSNDQVNDIKPKTIGIDFLHQNFVDIKNVRISTSSATATSIKPDTAAVGIYLPGINNGGNNHVNNLTVQGFHRGIVINENTNLDNITVAACWRALQFDSCYHTTQINRALVVWCPYKVFLPSSQAYFNIEQLDIEHYNAAGPVWFRDSLDLDAPRATNSMGKINYFIQEAFGGENVRGFSRNDNSLISGISIMPIGAGIAYHPIGGVNEEYIIGSDKFNVQKNYVFSSGTNKSTSLDLARNGVKQYSLGMGLQNAADNDFYMYNQITGRVSYYDSAGTFIKMGGNQAHINPALTIDNVANSATVLGNAIISNASVALGTGTALNFTHAAELGKDGSNHPMQIMHFSGGSTNQKNWYNYVDDGHMYFGTLNDAGSSPSFWLQVTENTGIPTVINFPNGNVGIGVSSPTNALEVAGNIVSTPVKITGNVGWTHSTEIGSEGSFPAISFHNASATTDQKNWDWYYDGNDLILRSLNDGISAVTTAIDINRSGYTVPSISFPNSKLFLGTVASGATTDSVLVINPSTKEVRWRNPSSFGGGGVDSNKVFNLGSGSTIGRVHVDTLFLRKDTGENGITVDTLPDGSLRQQIGGALNQNTTIDGLDTYSLTLGTNVVGHRLTSFSARATGDITLTAAGSSNILLIGNNTSSLGGTQLGSMSELSGTQTLNTSNTWYAYTGTGGDTWTLPTLASGARRVYFIKNAGSGAVTISRAGSDQIYDTSAVNTISIAAGASATLYAGPSFWYKL